MKDTMKWIVFPLLLLWVAGCSLTTSSEREELLPGDEAGGASDSSGDDLESFDIAFDTSVPDETEVIPTDESDESYEDYIEYSTFDTRVTIQYSNGKATVTNPVAGVTVAQDGAHVTVTSTVKKVEYVLTGSASGGSFKVYSDYKFKLTLNGVSLTNPAGAAINIQSKKRVFVVCNDGTTNTLVDGTSYTKTEGEDMKGCFFSEGQLIFSGKGTLDVTGKYKHGICSDDYVRFRAGTSIKIATSAGHGVKANDYIFIGGGVLNIEVTGNAGKGLSCDANVLVSGGRTTVITSGSGVYEDNDVSGCAGIKCDSVFTMNGGVLALKSTGAGGKGISADGDIVINDGTIKVLTTGQQYVYNRLDTSPKGIKGDANITITGGKITVRTSGGEGSEGIESKAAMTITGGTIEISAYDDCLNASNKITISGGSIYCYSSGNDGIDSNGALTITGGTIVASGTQSPEEGIDCDQNTFAITGGTLIGIGGSTSTPTTSQCKQPVIIYGGTGKADAYLSLAASDGTNVLVFKVPRAYSQMTLLVSSPSLKQGSSFTLTSGGALTGGTGFHGLTTGGTYSGGSKLADFTLSTMVTTYNFSGGMGGGPGGGPRGFQFRMEFFRWGGFPHRW